MRLKIFLLPLPSKRKKKNGTTGLVCVDSDGASLKSDIACVFWDDQKHKIEIRLDIKATQICSYDVFLL